MRLGRTRHGASALVPLGRPAHGVHSLILGATGSGKTVTQAAIAQAHILAGAGVIVIDPKGDPAMRATLEASAVTAGAAFHAWSPEGQTVYNPLRHGGVTEIADKALSAHEWSEPHYRTATQRLLGHALATLRARGEWPPTLSRLVEAMHPEQLDALAAGGEAAERVHAYVDSLDANARSALSGGRDRLAVLAESQLGACLDPSLGEGKEIDLTDALDRRAVIYLCQDADRYPEASRLLSAALLTDLAALAAHRQGGGGFSLVAIDEFGAVGGEQVARLAARCRGAGISLMIGTQSLADLRAVDPSADTLTEQILSNVAYLIAHRIGDPDSAERLARVAGTVPAWAMTQRVDGQLGMPSGEGTRTRQRDFRIGPDRFKTLRTGEAVLIRPTAKRPAEVIAVQPPRDAETARPPGGRELIGGLKCF